MSHKATLPPIWQYDVIPEGVKGIEFALLRNKGLGFLTLDRETIRAWQQLSCLFRENRMLPPISQFGHASDLGRGSTTQCPRIIYSSVAETLGQKPKALVQFQLDDDARFAEPKGITVIGSCLNHKGRWFVRFMVWRRASMASNIQDKSSD